LKPGLRTIATSWQASIPNSPYLRGIFEGEDDGKHEEESSSSKKPETIPGLGQDTTDAIQKKAVLLDHLLGEPH
jgi:hypothetical protein